MGTVITFPAERCTAASGPAGAHNDVGSVIILPVIRIEREDDNPSGVEPTSTSPRRKRRKR
jgi:hypothetical protein